MASRMIAAFWLMTLVLFVLPGSGIAQDQPVVSELTAFKVMKDAKGKDVFEKTDAVKPGDLIEYRLKYTNRQAKAIENLQPVLPVPNGTAYVAGSASPKLSAVSIVSGGPLMPFPPVRKVKNAQGKEVNEQVPASEFRSLQWTVSKLNAGASVTLIARVSVNSN